jgi:hypothetical protein
MAVHHTDNKPPFTYQVRQTLTKGLSPDSAATQCCELKPASVSTAKSVITD